MNWQFILLDMTAGLVLLIVVAAIVRGRRE